MKKNGSIKKNAIFIMVGATVALLAASYALFSFSNSNGSKNILTTGTLKLNLDEENSLTLANSMPITDSDAMSYEAYTFTVKNTGSENAKYRIYLVDDTQKYETDNCSDRKLPWSNIRYSIIKNSDANNIGTLGDSNGILSTTTIEAGTTDTYNLRFWISENATNAISNHHFHAKIQIKAILEDRTDFETGA